LSDIVSGKESKKNQHLGADLFEGLVRFFARPRSAPTSTKIGASQELDLPTVWEWGLAELGLPD
jgi:hypothetical protein